MLRWPWSSTSTVTLSVCFSLIYSNIFLFQLLYIYMVSWKVIFLGPLPCSMESFSNFREVGFSCLPIQLLDFSRPIYIYILTTHHLVLKFHIVQIQKMKVPGWSQVLYLLKFIIELLKRVGFNFMITQQDFVLGFADNRIR